MLNASKIVRKIWENYSCKDGQCSRRAVMIVMCHSWEESRVRKYALYVQRMCQDNSSKWFLYRETRIKGQMIFAMNTQTWSRIMRIKTKGQNSLLSKKQKLKILLRVYNLAQEAVVCQDQISIKVNKSSNKFNKPQNQMKNSISSLTKNLALKANK